MAEVTIHIPIREGYSGTSHLLESIYDMDFLPLVGDVFHPLRFDPESGLTFEVYRRYWNEQGKVVLEVAKHIIDPTDGPPALPRTWRGWWTDRDGDLVRMLIDNGWWHYGERESIG